MADADGKGRVMGEITPNRGDSPCVCGSIHLCCRFLVDGGCPHATAGDHPHSPDRVPGYASGGLLPAGADDGGLIDRVMGSGCPLSTSRPERRLSVGQSAEFERLRSVAEGFGVGEVVPESFTARVEDVFRAEVEQCEAAARRMLVDRVHAAVSGVRAERGEFTGPEQRAEAEAAVQVFVEFLRDPLRRPDSGPWASWGGDGVGP